MGIEIERKFLLRGEEWRELGSKEFYRQGYVAASAGKTVRVRTIGERGYLTIKGPGSGAARLEFEYEIPHTDAVALLDDLCEKPLIEKRRYTVDYAGFVWEIDEFFGDNQGLVVAEIELESVDQRFELPDWVGEEVTGDPRYFNASLVNKPFSTWKT